MQAEVGRCATLSGWETAWAVLWAIANRMTIVGQSALFGLHVRRTCHRVTGSAVLARDLCQEVHGIKMRKAFRPGSVEPHYALEDVLTRELTMFCIG